MNFWLTPVFTFYNRNFYRKISQSSLAYAFLYLTYLACIYALSLVIFTTIQIFPVMNDFSSWVQRSMPRIKCSADGLVSINRPSPYVMEHPQIGKLVVFDMNRKEVSPEEVPAGTVFVTQETLYLHPQNDTLKTIPLKDFLLQLGMTKPIEIQESLVEKINKIAKALLVSFCALIYVIYFIVTKTMAALFYALLVWAWIRWKKRGDSYRSQFILTIFALTPVAIYEMLSPFVFSNLAYESPFHFVMKLVLTASALCFAVYSTQQEG